MNLRKLRSLKVFQLFTIYIRYLIGGAFVFASIVKIQGNRFTTDSGAGSPINESWHLFETLYQSGIYWHFIGWTQMVAGFLLMTQVFSILGALMFLPIILNIFIITISYSFGGTPIITFLMLLANIYLLAWDWPRIKLVVYPFPTTFICDIYPFLQKQNWAYLGLFYFLLTLAVKLAVHSFFALLLVFGAACLIGLMVLIFNLKGPGQVKAFT